MSKATIIILGMHRSGTSLTSALCQSVGLDIGKNLIGATFSNPIGHFENNDFVILHDRILFSLKKSWCNLPEQEALDKAFLSFINEIKEVIDKNKSNFWGWKDPRNSLFFHLYINHGLVENPKLIICWRNPYAVASSLFRRDGFSLERGFRLAFEYYQRIITNLKSIKNSEKVPVLHIQYEDYFIDPEKNLLKISDFLDVAELPNKNLIQRKYKHC